MLVCVLESLEANKMHHFADAKVVISKWKEIFHLIKSHKKAWHHYFITIHPSSPQFLHPTIGIVSSYLKTEKQVASREKEDKKLFCRNNSSKKENEKSFSGSTRGGRNGVVRQTVNNENK